MLGVLYQDFILWLSLESGAVLSIKVGSWEMDKKKGLEEEYKQIFNEAEGQYDDYVKLNTIDLAEIIDQANTEKRKQSDPHYWDKELCIFFPNNP